jgi:hypothetical protein
MRGAVMRRFRWVRVVVVFGLAGALVGVVADGVSRCEDQDQALRRHRGRLSAVLGGGHT